MTLHKFAIARHLLLAALLIVGTLAAVLLWATLLTAAAGIPPPPRRQPDRAAVGTDPLHADRRAVVSWLRTALRWLGGGGPR